MSSLPQTVIIFGASGDLTARKLIPSLYNLCVKKRLPDDLQIVGVSRRAMSDDQFRQHLMPWVKEFVKGQFRDDSWNTFAQRLHYVAADAGTAEGMAAVEAYLKKRENGPGARLYYLSVSPDLYASITKALAANGMAKPPSPDAFRRAIIEKPFGRDLQTARELNAAVAQVFEEDQLFRIDHYLGKETVQNLLVFRFANTLFEPLWNNNYIDHVQITVAESVTVEGRVDYYDHYGVMRDMFQNHMMQILALVAMEAPARFAATPLRNEKVKVLDAIPIYEKSAAKDHVVAGQYEGYLEELAFERKKKDQPPARRKSRTPTFAALELYVENWRWRGVPFYLRSGKGLNSRVSEVVIQFRCPPHIMFPLPPGTTLQCNRLAICLQPDEGIHVNFQSKVPDQTTMQLRPTDMAFHYKSAYPDAPIPEAYERLIGEALAGDASLFMRADEIERAWAIMDPLIEAIEDDGGAPLLPYAKGSAGPTCADEFLARGGRSWLSLCGAKK
jgi:glucose-6-phosphate 1-dehydrogenase